MAFLSEFWIPILLSAVAVFIASSVIHMMLPIHGSDTKALPDEGKLLDAMRGHNLAPGTYMFPKPSCMKDMGSDEMIEKYQQGPVGFMTVLPTGTPGMGKALIQWFLFSILVSVFVAYVLSFTRMVDADYMDVFRISGTAAFLAYGFGEFNASMWKGQSWWVTGKFMFDGLVYALVTAGVFGTFAA